MARNKFPNANELITEPGVVSLMTKQALDLASWESIDIKDSDAIAKRCDEYFRYCIDTDRRPVLQGLCLALGTNRQSLINWEKEDSRRGQAIRKAKNILRFLLEEWTSEGKISPPSGIFLLKVYCGYQETIVLETGTQNTDGTADLSPSQIQKLLDEDIPIEGEYKEVQDNAE